MTSPSVSSQGSKRKRTGTDALVAQTSPREDDETSRPNTRGSVATNNLNSGGSSNGGPNPKRQRANSSAASRNNDLGEPSDTTEASVADIVECVGRKRAGTAGEDKMPPPPFELVHPVGFKTNTPPTCRSVRVYADGVFDMFHLG